MENDTEKKGETDWTAELQTWLGDIRDHAVKLLADVKAAHGRLDDIRDLLSPERNGASIKAGKLMKALLHFRRGTIPAVWLTEWHTASMQLADELMRRYPEVTSLHHTADAQKGLYDLICERYDEYETDAAYFKEVCHKIGVLRGKYRENSDGFDRLFVERRATEAKETKPKARRPRRAKDSEVTARREGKRKILKAICDAYDKGVDSGRKRSYERIVREMVRPGNTYSARMRGCSVAAWVNQASAYGKRRREGEV